MTRPAAHPACVLCAHCHERIYQTGRTWCHDGRNRDHRCIIASQHTGDLAHPAGTPCPDGCANRMQIIDYAEHVRDE